MRIAGLSGRPRIYAASLGLSVAHVHLVMASTTPALATVLLDAGLEVWCADIPRHATLSQLLTQVCDLAATDALQVNTEIVPPFRHGDVLPVRLEADRLRVDLTRQTLARPDLSATMWLDPVQSFYMLTHSSGLQGFQIAVGSEVTFHLLHSLLPPQESLGGSFLELPTRANFPHRIFVHCGQGRDHVVFRVSGPLILQTRGFFFSLRVISTRMLTLLGCWGGYKPRRHDGFELCDHMDSLCLHGSPCLLPGQQVAPFGMFSSRRTSSVPSFILLRFRQGLPLS